MNSAEPIASGRPRVLVVDDDEAVLTMAQAILKSAGFETAPAQSGEEAVRIYHECYFSGQSINLVLLDITLPGGMNGIETLDALRAIDPEACVLASSGYFDDSAAQAARKRGFVGILPKPYTADRLAKMVQWSLSRAA